jgi:hypothetical protein
MEMSLAALRAGRVMLLIVADLTYIREFEPLELYRLLRLITFHVTPSKTRQPLLIRDTRCHLFNGYYQDFSKSQNKMTKKHQIGAATLATQKINNAFH